MDWGGWQVTHRARRPSSKSSGNGQVISKASTRDSSFWVVPTLILMLALICRIKSLVSRRKRNFF